MRNFKIKYVISAILFCAVIILSCEKIPSSPEVQNYYDFSVVVVNESGYPLNGVKVTTFPTTIAQITNKAGRVLFENIPGGDYQIVLSRSDIPIFYRDYRLKKSSIKEWKFVIASKMTINIYVKNISGQPIDGIEINTSPISMTAVTDEKGHAVLENVPVSRYTFVVKRLNSAVYIKDKVLRVVNGQPQDIEIVIDSQIPFIKILAPENRTSHNIYNIHFSAEGYDFEDGDLPDNSFTWYSDIDGVLGTGRELTVDRLSVGWNKITLKSMDSNRNSNEASIYLNFYQYEKDSYFPVPVGAYWNYRYSNPVFTINNEEGETEHWKISELEVLIDELNTRSCKLIYTVTIKNRTRSYSYYVVDYYDVDNDTISLSKTTEMLKIWRSINMDTEPIEQLDIETVYLPGYLIIKNHEDLIENDSYETSVSAETTWRYFDALGFGKIYEETIEIDTNVEIGGMEIVETAMGAFEAATLNIYIENSVRKWWLAKGIGIVQIEYDTFDFPVSATLFDTNILNYSEENQLHKLVNDPLFASPREFRKKITSPMHTPERMLEICGILRELCPR